MLHVKRGKGEGWQLAAQRFTHFIWTRWRKQGYWLLTSEINITWNWQQPISVTGLIVWHVTQLKLFLLVWFFFPLDDCHMTPWAPKDGTSFLSLPLQTHIGHTKYIMLGGKAPNINTHIYIKKTYIFHTLWSLQWFWCGLCRNGRDPWTPIEDRWEQMPVPDNTVTLVTLSVKDVSSNTTVSLHTDECYRNCEILSRVFLLLPDALVTSSTHTWQHYQEMLLFLTAMQEPS